MIKAILRGTLALAVLAAMPAVATVVDIDALTNSGLTSAPAVVLALGAGTYKATPIIGTYTAFSRFSSESGCNGDGIKCTIGFEHSYKIDIGGTVTGYGDNAGNGGIGPQSGGGYYATQAQAFTLGSQAATFTLAAPTSVKFFIYDDILGDNRGGVSLDVTAVPEAATWAVMVAGFGLVGASLRRRQAAAA